MLGMRVEVQPVYGLARPGSARLPTSACGRESDAGEAHGGVVPFGFLRDKQQLCAQLRCPAQPAMEPLPRDAAVEVMARDYVPRSTDFPLEYELIAVKLSHDGCL